MSERTVYEALFSTKENEKQFYEAGILVEVCEKLYELMAKNGYKNKDIAKKLDVSASQVSQWLDGAANMQLKTIADILFAMDLKFKTFVAESISKEIKITVKDVEAKSDSGWNDPYKLSHPCRAEKSHYQFRMAS